MSRANCRIVRAAGVVIFFFLLSQAAQVNRQTAGLAFIDSRALAQGGRIFNVKEFGAKGDGMADDTAAIQRTIDKAPDRSTIYFPAGTYLVANFVVKKRSGLSFNGEERTAVIRRKPGAARMATFQGSSDIVVTKLAFDANGIDSYGGVVFYAAKGVVIENNSFVDSAPKHNRAGDHYSFVLGKGAEPSRDVKILNNVMEFLQLEVDHAKNVVIEGNIVKRPIGTSGIGIFTVGNDAVAEDYVIKKNTVIDPPKAGLHAVLDPPASRNCVFRRIAFIDNTIIRTKTAGYAIQIGTLDNSQRTTGNVFEDITVRDNRIRIESGAPPSGPMIFANSSKAAGVVFKRLAVVGNEIHNQGRGNKGYAIELRYIQDSVVADNTIKGVADGISLAGALRSNELRNNTVEVSGVGFRVDGSLGQNRAADNRVLGQPRQPWTLTNLNASDVIDR
jgi:parallel beta-helix repeat protein